MWENLDPVWGTGSFERFYNGSFKVLLSTQPEDFDEWWEVNRECAKFLDDHIQYLSNPLHSITRDSTINLQNLGSELETFLKKKFPDTANLLLDPITIRICEDLSVELSLHQLEVFGFVNMALLDPLLQIDSGKVDIELLSSTVIEFYYRELKFLLLTIHELANNCHPCVVLGVLCDNESDTNKNITQSPSNNYADKNTCNIFTSQCPPICIYGCTKILNSGFVKNAVNSIFQIIQEIIKLGQANIKTEPQSMIDTSTHYEVNNCLRDHYRNIISQLTDTIAILFSRFTPNIEEVEALMELIPNVAKIHPSFLTNRPTAADYDSWDNMRDDSKEKLTLSAKILFIIIISFDFVPQRWKRDSSISAYPSSLYDSMSWFLSSKRLPISSKQNLFSIKHPLISKLLQEYVNNDFSKSLSLNDEISKPLVNEFWDIDTSLGKFAAFAINGAFGENSKKRFMGITHWKIFHYIQNDLMPYLDPLDPVHLIFIQAIYDFYSVSLNPTQDPIQWSRILQLQRRILMERDSRQKVEKDQSDLGSKGSITSILSPIICCLNVLCRRYPLASWGASKILSSCIEMFPTLSMYSSYGETDQNSSSTTLMPPVLSELFIDLLDLAATIMIVGHYSLGQQIAHFLQNQPSNIWFHLPSITQFITRTLSLKFANNKREDDQLIAFENSYSTRDQPKLGIWSGSGLDRPQFFHSFCRAVLRILSYGFSTRLNISHPPPPPLLNLTINLQGGKTIANFVTIVFRDWSENSILDDPKLAYALQVGCLDAFSNGLIHFQSSEILEIISNKIPIFTKTIQYSINQNDDGIFLIKLISCIITLQFRASNTNDLLVREIIEPSRRNKSSIENHFHNSKYQLPILRWILRDILPLLENQEIFLPTRYWTISTLVLKYIRFILSRPLPENTFEFTDDSDAIIWLLRCLLSIDSPTFHQLMRLVILHGEPQVIFLQGQNNDPSNKFKMATANIGLDIIRIILQRDYLFINWVQYHKNTLNQQYSNLLMNNNVSTDQEKILFDTEAIDVLSSTNSALIPFHEQLALPPPKISKSSNVPKNYFYRYNLLKYMIIGIDAYMLKSIVFITYQLIYRDPESITALLTEFPSLLLQLRSTITGILSNPTNDKFPVNIQKFISNSNDSFTFIWNSANSFIPTETDSGIKYNSLISDQQAIFWEEITETDTNSSLYSCDYNLLGNSCKTLIPIHYELENYWNLYLNALTESSDLSLWNKLKELFKNDGTISSTKLDILKANDIILNGYLHSILPTFIPNKSCIYNKIARIHLTSTRSIILYTFARCLEEKYIYPKYGLKNSDASSSIIPLLLGLNLKIATDVPTINEYFLFSKHESLDYSLKTYDEIYIPDSSSFSDEGTFPLLIIMDILSVPPQIPLSQPNEERLNHPCVDFAILTQLELYYLSLRLVINLLKIPQLIDYTIRIIITRLNSRYSVLKERILIPTNWIPIEYRWLHYLHISMIINLISTEIFIVSQVASAIKMIEDSETDNSLLCDTFWLSSVQNLDLIFKIFLGPPKTSGSASDQFDILSVILNIGQAIIDDESDLEFQRFNEQVSRETYLFHSFIAYTTSQNLACGLYKTSYYSIFTDYNGDEKVFKEPFNITFSNSIYTTSYHLFINEYVQFFGLLLNKYSSFSYSRQIDFDSENIEISVYFTLQSIIELCRPYINYSFFKKTPIPLATAILSIFSQTFLTILKRIYIYATPNLKLIPNEEFYFKFYNSQSHISELQKQKICFTTIQDCCEDIVHLLTELEKASLNSPKYYFPFEWKNILLLLLSNCVSIDSIQILNNNQNQENNENFTSSFLRHIWPEIWSSSQKTPENSSFNEFVTLLIGNLRIPNFKQNFSIEDELKSYLPINVDSKSVSWIIKPQEIILLNNIKDKKKFAEQINRFTFHPNMLIGIKTEESCSFLSLYLLFLIYNKIYHYRQHFKFKFSSIIVPYENGEEHTQNLQTLMETSKLSNQSCIVNLLFWNYITINWINLSPLFLRKLVESNYLNYLLSQEVLIKVLQDFLQFFLDFHIVGSENSLDIQFKKISDHLELILSLFSLIIEIINKGIIPRGKLSGYGSIDNFETILNWIEKLESFFNSFLEFFIKHLLFCQHKKTDWYVIIDKSSQLNVNKFGNQYIIEKFSPFLCAICLLFSKVLRVKIQIMNTNNTINIRKTDEFNDHIDSNIITINILHNKCGQIIEVISQMVSTQMDSNCTFPLLISCISWLETESDFFISIGERLIRNISLNINAKFVLSDENRNNYDISTVIKLNYDIIKWLTTCNNNLFSSMKDKFEHKTSSSKYIDQIQKIVMFLTKSNVTILTCYFNNKNLNSSQLLGPRGTLCVEDNHLETIRNCINNLNLILNIENRSNFVDNRIPEILKNCEQELEILRNIKFKFESIVN